MTKTKEKKTAVAVALPQRQSESEVRQKRRNLLPKPLPRPVRCLDVRSHRRPQAVTCIDTGVSVTLRMGEGRRSMWLVCLHEGCGY